MIKLAIKIIFANRIVSILFIMGLSLTIGISLCAININEQIKEGFFKADQKYDVIIGPAGSSTQLIMSSLFLSDEPLGAIPFDLVDKVKNDYSINKVLPIALGDNYKGAKVIGSTSEFLSGYEIKKGIMFKNDFEIVAGYQVAKTYKLNIGDKLITSHGANAEITGHVHENSYTLVGILEKTNTSFDNAVYCNINSIWKVHGNHHEEETEAEVKGHEGQGGHEEEEAHAEHDGDVGHEEEEAHAEHDGDAEHEEEEAYAEHDEHEMGVTAILVSSKNLAESNKIVSEYNKNGYQAVEVTRTLRKIMSGIDLSRQVSFILTGLIIVLSMLVVFIMTYIILTGNKKHIRTLEIMGFGASKINGFTYYQIGILTSCSVIISILISRICLNAVNSISSTMGIVIDISRIYNSEIYAIIAIIIILHIPILLFNSRRRIIS